MASDRDYDTLTRSSESSGNGYWNLSDAHTSRDRAYLESDFSGSFDDPTPYLDGPLAGLDTIGRRPQMPIPVFTDSSFLPKPSLQPDVITPYTDSDEDFDDSDPPPVVIETMNRQRTESDVIDIIGSLCIQGVFQGLSENNDNQMPHLPSSIQMTDNLVQRTEEFNELSVMVTRNIEIVPETPFDTNIQSKKSFGKIRTKKRGNSVPRLRLRARSDIPVRPQSLNLNKVDHRPTSVTYYDNIVRPQPLPPLDESLSKEEKKRYKVMESLLESEAAFLTSLNIAIEVYRKPLLLRVSENSPILDTDQINKLFGPIKVIQSHHELFYAALSEETKDWSPNKEIGGIFLASFSRKDVILQYCKYVNNYSSAMNTLETNIKKKVRFLDFLKKQFSLSGTQLSLQALLLKPVQRFPQYLLFLQDLIKYTSPSHLDQMKLQMAQAQIERVAEYLNEAKRSAEQLLIVQYLSAKIVKMPFKIMDQNKFLIRQDSISWISKKSDGTPIIKRRQLFLFNNMLVCCHCKERKKVQVEDVLLTFKWYSPIVQLRITEPDFTKEQRLSVYFPSLDQDSEESSQQFEKLRNDLRNLNDDFDKLCKIESIASSLNGQYESIDLSNIHASVRVVQRKLEKVRDELRNFEPGRVDITIPGKDLASKSQYRHILLFQNNNTKKSWLKAVHFATLRLSQGNQQPWIMEEEDEKPSTIFNSSGVADENVENDSDLHNGTSADSILSCSIDSLPLVVDQIKLMGAKNECTSVECATSVGGNCVWFSCSGAEQAQIAVVRCLMPTPMLLETFTVNSKRVLCMKTIHTSRPQLESSNPCPSGSQVVWLGSSCGKLMLYDPLRKNCVNTITLKDSILCIESFKNRAFVGLANGKVEVYTRMKGGQWDLKGHVHHIPVAESPIQCFCPVESELWIGVANRCIMLNMKTLKLEHSIKLTDEQGVSVKRITSSNKGVWMALSRGGTLSLYHKETRQPIQEIDIKGSLMNIVSCADLHNRFPSLDVLHITALLVSSGYLWVGTNQGALLVYRIPYLHGLPMTTGKPMLASYGHTDALRVLIEVQTILDIPSARFDQFVTDEKERKIGMFQAAEQVTDVSNGDANSDEVAENPMRENHSMKIDESALPMVSDIIQRLEQSKLGKLPTIRHNLLNIQKPLLVQSPRGKELKGKTASTNTHNEILQSERVPSIEQSQLYGDTASGQGNVSDVATIDEPPIDRESTQVQNSQVTTNSANNDFSEETADSISQSQVDFPNDYEMPMNMHTYDDVPVEEDDLEIQPVLSDTDITLQRYEGEPVISFGDGLYDDFRRSTVSFNVPGQSNAFVGELNESHMFVFTGGRGLVDFRPNSVINAKSNPILNATNLDIAASSNVYQIPRY